MAVATVQAVLDQVRSNLSDNLLVSTGESFPNSVLIPLFAEPYRSMFSRLVGGSKRVQKIIYVVLPANTTVLIPSTFAITDMSEPEMVEERPAPNSVSITSTSTATPIVVNAPNHGLSNGTFGTLSGVSGTGAPWGRWYITVIDANNFSLNGSASDGTAGTGGFFYPDNAQQFVETSPIDLTAAGLDGPPQSTLGVYLWANEMFQFRGASSAIQLRITYYASGTAPTNPNYVIPIDNCIDFLAAATTANAARSKNWMTVYETWRNMAYGDPTHPEELSLLDLFFNQQVLAAQRGPQRRQQPYRDKRSKFGSYVLG